jgi:hypothetical protein
VKRSLASTELLVSFLFLFILSTFACIIAGPEDDFDEQGTRISMVQGGPGYLDCTFIFVYLKLSWLLYQLEVLEPSKGRRVALA